MRAWSERFSLAGKRVLAVGSIDILVNNAGIALVEPLIDASVESWDRTQTVNLRAPFPMVGETLSIDGGFTAL